MHSKPDLRLLQKMSSSPVAAASAWRKNLQKSSNGGGRIYPLCVFYPCQQDLLVSSKKVVVDAGRPLLLLLDSLFGVEGLVVPSEQSTPSHSSYAILNPLHHLDPLPVPAPEKKMKTTDDRPVNRQWSSS
jgi:hypothetical protein